MVRVCAILFFFLVYSFLSFGNNSLSIPATLTYTYRHIDTIPAKVSISNGNESLDIFPVNEITNDLLIQPVSRSTNTGVSTSFYLTDTASWNFYTNSLKRLSINGNGNITTTSSLLINNAQPNPDYSLRVNGKSRIDSSLLIAASSDTKAFISLERDVKHLTEAYDSNSAYTTTPTSWAGGDNIPVFRLRRSNTLANSQLGVNPAIRNDFMILPYEYGTAIEFNGVVECWVGEWSIHRGLQYPDTEGNGNGWGGVLWVGDDNDDGGVRATARDNTQTGGDVKYGEISVERFTSQPLGDFRFRLPSTEHSFQFVYGKRGSTNVVASLSSEGLLLPKVGDVNQISSPGQAQLVFDSTGNILRYFDGTTWKTVGDAGNYGSVQLSGNGLSTVFYINHSLGKVPSFFNVIAANAAAANISYVTATNTQLEVHYLTAPAAGVKNVYLNWEAKE